MYIHFLNLLKIPLPAQKNPRRSTSRLDQVTSGGVERSASHHGLGHEVPHHREIIKAI